MSSFAGTYAIRAALTNSNNTYLNIPVFNNRLFAPVVGRVPSSQFNETGPPLWNITAVGGVGSNLYTIVNQQSQPITTEGAGDTGLRVYFFGSHPPAQVSIESAGSNIVRFHVPNVDSVWTVADDGNATSPFGSPVTRESDQGLEGQRWSLESLN